MSKEAIEYKSLHKDINFENLGLAELNKLPSHNGVYDFKISKTSFLMLNIINDDSSVVKHFWKGSHDLEELDLCFLRGYFIFEAGECIRTLDFNLGKVAHHHGEVSFPK